MFKTHLPVLEWLSHYRLAWLRDDLIAGLTVWTVMVPTALAYTGIAGVPGVMGLYTQPFKGEPQLIDLSYNLF